MHPISRAGADSAPAIDEQPLRCPEQTLGKKLRITRRDEFSRMFEQGRKRSDGLVTLFVLPNELGFARLGVAVATRHGNAVRRNRVKRLAREAFRLLAEQLPAGWDYMVVPRSGREFTLEKMQRSIRNLSAALTAAPNDRGKGT